MKIQYDLMIVIPAYNVRAYIKECLESVLSQETDYSFQVVIVDDGSTDGTAEIIDAFKQDDRLLIIHQQNGGIACARNRALKTITGKYLMFVDADDVLYPGAIQYLINRSYELDADIVEGGRRVFQEDPREGEIVQYEDTYTDTSLVGHHGAPWAKVFRSSLFEKLCYPEGYEFEDSIISYCVFPMAKKSYTISNIVYGLRVRPESITKTAEGSARSVDTCYLTLFLWGWHQEHFACTAEFQMQALRQVLLNHKRTVSQGKNVQRNIFSLQSIRYAEMFSKETELSGRYRLLDRVLREQKWNSFEKLAARWDYLL